MRYTKLKEFILREKPAIIYFYRLADYGRSLTTLVAFSSLYSVWLPEMEEIAALIVDLVFTRDWMQLNVNWDSKEKIDKGHATGTIKNSKRLTL